MNTTAGRHAYLIAAHNKPEQLCRLLRLLDDVQNDLYLHIDRKANDISADMLRAQVKHAAISFVPRMDANWGSEVFIDVIVSLLEAAARTEHAYYHFLSGVDLPLKTQSEIRAFFRAHAGSEFVAFDRETVDQKMLKKRIGLYYMPIPARPVWRRAFHYVASGWLRLQRLFGVNRLKNCDVVFQKGAVWFSITHAFAVYALAHAPQYRNYYRRSVCADEIWLQTILANSPFMQNRFFMGWNDEPAATMRFIDWPENARSPRVLTMRDYDALTASGMLFARKFDDSVDQEVIDRIVQALGAE
jgi:hypothetical protein